MYVCIYIILYLATMLGCSSKHQKEFDIDINPEQHLSVSCINMLYFSLNIFKVICSHLAINVKLKLQK